jgi:nucleoside-diphosphate-sugar epimerase
LKPAYPKFFHANVEVCKRVLTQAQRAGVTRAVLLGSYFAHFNRLWPELRLLERHPYIRSRVEQERLATEISGLTTCVLELPYIFGDTLGRKPLWYPLVKYIRSMPLLFYPKGGSACITAETVGQAVAAACENGQAGKCYPIGDENLSWPELLQRLAAADERRIRVVTLPTWLVKITLYGVWLFQKLQRKESGLDPRYLVDIQVANTFLDPEPSREELGYQTGGLDRAFQQTIAGCQ